MADEFQSSRPCECEDCQKGLITLHRATMDQECILIWETPLNEEYGRNETDKST